MQIERKQLNDKESILFFSNTLQIVGTLLVTKKVAPEFGILENIFATQLADTILLTKDFLYLKSISSKDLQDLEMISLAELDDFTVSITSINAPTINSIEKIEIILKTIVAPFLQKDGGDIRLSQYKDNTVYVKFLGKCHGCPYAERTLKERVEKNLIRYLPEIKEVKLI